MTADWRGRRLVGVDLGTAIRPDLGRSHKAICGKKPRLGSEAWLFAARLLGYPRVWLSAWLISAMLFTYAQLWLETWDLSDGGNGGIGRIGLMRRMGRRIGQWDDYAIGLLESPEAKSNP